MAINSRPGLAMTDGDPAWQDYVGTLRVRDAGTGVLQIQVSDDNGDGTYSVTTFNVEGNRRDTRQSATEWPAYPPRDAFTG